LGKAFVFNGIHKSFPGKVSTMGFFFTSANGVAWLFNHGQVEVGLLLRDKNIFVQYKFDHLPWRRIAIIYLPWLGR
jgi:hypothetical protein